MIVVAPMNKPLFRLSILSLSLFFTVPAWAVSLDTVFRDSFFDSQIYEENRCGQNIERLLIRLQDSGIELDGLEVFEIINQGIENFGLLAAYQARVGYQTNWGHHVVLFDGKKIYDLDFTRSPDPRSPSNYFDEMFKNERTRTDRARCLKTVGTYELRIYQAQDYLDYMSRRGRMKIKATRLKDLPKWGCG